jgi:three-Cys-motif partner protein
MGLEAYVNREQAFVKHFVLKNYLQRLAMKVGHFAPGTTLNYIDGFSGPWDAVSPNWADSSPYIAAAELKKARDILGGLPKPVPLTVRCMFVESDESAYERLREVATSLGSTEVVTYFGEFESHVDAAVRFARGGQRPFCFAFIDPTGWTGYGLNRIAPLLQVRPSEVLINFMTKDILRFVDDEDSSALQSFRDLFGETSYRESWRGQTGLDREDAIVRRYCERVKAAGAFTYCTSAVIVNPAIDRTHYHLVYATRSIEGLVTFREVERQAAHTQRTLRAGVRARKEQERTAQMPLFEQPPTDSGYVDLLQRRYQSIAEIELLEHLTGVESVSYDDVLCTALGHPFVSESAFKEILTKLRGQERLEVIGLKPRERSPKRKSGIRIKRTKAL